jgi:hypothetical protein
MLHFTGKIKNYNWLQSITETFLHIKKSILEGVYFIFWLYFREKINFAEDIVDLKDLTYRIEWRKFRIGGISVFAPVAIFKLKSDDKYTLTSISYNLNIRDGKNKLIQI